MANIVLILLLIGAWFWGYKQGLVKMLSTIGAVLGGVLIARRVTPLILSTFNLQVNPSPEMGFVAQMFMAETGVGKLVEMIIYILTFILAFWILRLLAGFLGEVVNSIPLVGFIGRILGGVIGLFMIVAIAYILMWWVFPIIDFKEGTDFLNSASFVMPYVNQLGDWVFNMVSAVLAPPEFALPGVEA